MAWRVISIFVASTLLMLDLTHWGRVTHICVGKQTIIGSDNGLSPGRRQAIIWTNAGILLIGPLGTNLSEISIKILTFSFTKMRLKVSSAKWRPFCLGLNGLKFLIKYILIYLQAERRRLPFYCIVLFLLRSVNADVRFIVTEKISNSSLAFKKTFINEEANNNDVLSDPEWNKEKKIIPGSLLQRTVISEYAIVW